MAANSSLGVRVLNTSPIGSATRRRAVNPSAFAEAWSNQCWSSTRHSSGCPPATSDNRPSAASPTRNRSGTGPSLSPNATRSAWCCGAGRSPLWLMIGAHS